MKLYINSNLEICANENGWPEEPTPGDDIAAYHANMNYYRRWLKEAKEQSVIVYDVPHDLGLHFDVRNWSADMFIEMPCDVEFGWQFKNEDDQWINATNGDLRFIFAKYKTRKVARLKQANAAHGYTEGSDVYGANGPYIPADLEASPFPQNPQVSAVEGPWSITPEEERIQMVRCCQDMHKENEQLRSQLAAAEKRVKEMETKLRLSEILSKGYREQKSSLGADLAALNVKYEIAEYALRDIDMLYDVADPPYTPKKLADIATSALKQIGKYEDTETK